MTQKAWLSRSFNAFRLSAPPYARIVIGYQIFPLLLGFWRWHVILKKDLNDCFASLTNNTAYTFLSHSNKYDKETRESPDLKICIVYMSRSAAGIAFLSFVSFFGVSGPARLNKCSNLSGDIRKKLKM